MSSNDDVNFNHLPVALIWLQNNKIYYLNKRAKQILKISENQLKGLHNKSIFDFMDLENQKQFKKQSSNLLSGLKINSESLVLNDLNNKPIAIEAYFNSVLHQNKRFIQVVFNDVSERNSQINETQQLLNKTKEQFDLITNYSNEVITFYSFYPVEKYIYVSSNIERILGYKPNELLNNKDFFKDKIVENKVSYFKTDKLLKQYQKGSKLLTHHQTNRFCKKNKDEIWIENNFVPVANSKGKIEFFIHIIRDITLQKERELEIQLQYDNYRNLLDNSPVAYVIHDHGVCLYVNNSLIKLLKLKTKNKILGKFIVDFFNEEDRKKVTERISKVYANKAEASKLINYTITDQKGNILDVEIKSVPIKFNNKDCILSLVNNLSEQKQREREKQKVITIEAANRLLQIEIKERQAAEKNLTEKTAHLSSIFESSTHLLWTVSRDYSVTSYNKNYADFVYSQHKVKIKQGDQIHKLLKNGVNEYVGFWHARYEEAFQSKKLEFEKVDFQDGEVYRKVFINPIYNKNNDITELSCIANDITDSKIYEQKLLNQTGKLTAIFDSSHHYIWTINREERLTSFNKNYYDLITSLYNTKPYVGLVLDRGVLANDKEYTMLLKHHYTKAFNGIASSFEIETRDQEYKNVYLVIFLNPIYENEKVVEVSGIAHNITEKKHVQQRMEVSLKEKEILLREVHHRVKNNMQVISSILNLQSSYVSDEYTLTLLKESQNRIKTMAYIHESLYQNKSFTSVNFSDYVHTLVNNIVQSYSYSSDKITLELNIQKMTLSLDSSIPAGLIINELITNAIKHAFPGTRKGNITFNLRCENNLVILELTDNGVGFAQGVDFENSHSLGLQLVNTLTEQIEGQIKFKSQKDVGTEVVVTFNM
ncbi:MAG: PAS domain S-box protein [Bacteroidia bacterium]|nr:PAS domain S-box protein [Bacteroidia bacterium]